MDDIICQNCHKLCAPGEFHVSVSTKPGCLSMSHCPAWEDGMHAFVPFFQVGSLETYERRVTPGSDVRMKRCACGAEVKRTA